MMRPLPELASILAEIVTTGLLMIRQYGWASDPDRCAIEADHIHNLPGIMANYSSELLGYYWDVERTAFMAHLSTSERQVWEGLWERLRPLVDATREEVLIGRDSSE